MTAALIILGAFGIYAAIRTAYRMGCATGYLAGLDDCWRLLRGEVEDEHHAAQVEVARRGLQ